MGELIGGCGQVAIAPLSGHFWLHKSKMAIAVMPKLEASKQRGLDIHLT